MKTNISGVSCIFYVRFKALNKVIFGALGLDIAKKRRFYVEIICPLMQTEVQI